MRLGGGPLLLAPASEHLSRLHIRVAQHPKVLARDHDGTNGEFDEVEAHNLVNLWAFGFIFFIATTIAT